MPDPLRFVIIGSGNIASTCVQAAGAGGAAVSDTTGHEAIIADFIAAVRDHRPPAVSGEQARAATELIQRIYKAAGRPWH